MFDCSFLSKKDSTDNKENESVDDSADVVLTLPDANTIAGILETIAISWAGIQDQLDKVWFICNVQTCTQTALLL